MALTSNRRLQIRLIEGVSDVPSERPELASLLHIGVEEQQTQQQLLPLLALHRHALVVLLFDQVGEGTQKVGFDALRRFVCHLHTILQNGHREIVCGGRRQVQTEVLVNTTCKVITEKISSRAICEFSERKWTVIFHGPFLQLKDYLVQFRHPALR